MCDFWHAAEVHFPNYSHVLKESKKQH